MAFVGRSCTVRLPLCDLVNQAHTEDAKAGGTAPGIAIFVFGRKEYLYAAQHLALSLREHSPTVPVHLWAAEGMNVDASYYTEVHTLDAKWYANGPGSLKLNVHDILPEGRWMYVDADMLCVSDIAPALERLKAYDFALDVRGKGKFGADIQYTPWAMQETVKRVAELGDDATYYGVQTSWVWINKGSKLCADIYATAKALRFTPDDLKEPWGGSIPDELCISAALSKLGIDPHSEDLSFYGTRGAYPSLSAMRQRHAFACLYGDTRRHRLVASSWLDQYDRFVRSMYARNGGLMGMDIHSIMRNKHVTR